MQLHQDFEKYMIPCFLGYFSESLSTTNLQCLPFEMKLKDEPPNEELWSNVLILINKIICNEILLELKKGEFPFPVAYKIFQVYSELDKIIQTFKEYEYLKMFHYIWIHYNHGYISHPDTHSPDEHIDHQLNELFGFEWSPRDWDKYKPIIKETLFNLVFKFEPK